MSIPEQELKFFDFSGGMNTELGLVNTDEKVAKNLENVELKSDGSAERRSGLSFFIDPSQPAVVTDLSHTLNITSQRSSVGWVYPAPSVFFWKTVKDNKPVTIMVVSNVVEDTNTTPTYYMKELVYGISSIEDWRTSKGTKILNTASLSAIDATAPNFKFRFTDGGNFLIVTNEDTKPSAIIGAAATASTGYDILTRDPDSLTPDKVVKNGGTAYVAIRTHTSSAATEPGVGASWKNYWRKAGIGGAEAAWATATSYNSNINTLWTNLGFDSVGTGEKKMTHSVFAGGRAWYTGVPETPTTIYITQPLLGQKIDSSNLFELGFCFSINDPLSSIDSSHTAADGGTIDIKEAGIIKSITTFREGLLVFASNGVWSIPNAGHFNATNFDVLKVSDVPITGPDAFAVTDFGVVYYGKNSVQIVAITDNGNIIAQELSTPIKTFYNSISEFSKEASFAVYNKLQQRVYWFTTFVEPAFELGAGSYRLVNYNGVAVASQDILVFDFKLKAWYKHTTIRQGQEITDNDLVIAHADTFVGDFGETPRVLAINGDTVESNSGADLVFASDLDGIDIKEFLVMLVTGEDTVSSGADRFQYGFTHFNGDVVQDFDNLSSSQDTLKSTFDSEILSQQFNFTDIGHNKQAPYIHTIFRRVESGTLDGTGDDTTPGGCLIQFRWNWSTGTAAGSKFGTAFQAYRPFRWNINPNDGSLPDIEVVLNRHKIMGRGKALQLRFTNDETKRFHLLGYQLEVEATKKV